MVVVEHPKSASWMAPLSRSTLDALMSLWMIPTECRYASPLRSWEMYERMMRQFEERQRRAEEARRYAP